MKKFIALLLTVINIILLCGCSDNTNSAIIYYGVKTPPITIDPQLASTVTELTIVKNIFEGLVREDANGNIVPATAESYEKNGNTYTFKIANTARWSNGETVTSEDFVFALTRALDPITASPEASSLFSIKNAKQYNSGNPVLLGVSAPDNKTLIIELEYDDPNFLTVLTTCVSMPCNRKFFEESAGKYGMSEDTVLSNGSFELTKWSTDDFAMRLHKNDEYTGKFEAGVAAVFLSYDDEETTLQRILDNSVDIGEIENNEINEATANNLSTVFMPNTVWLLNIGKGYSEPLKNSLVRSLVIYSDTTSVYPNGITPAINIYPEFFNIEEKIDIYDLNYAKSNYATEITKLANSTLPTNTLYYREDGNMVDLAKMIVGHWQQNLGAYINIEALSSNASVFAKQNEYSLTIYSEQINSANITKYTKFFGTENTVDLKNEILNGNIFPVAYSGTVIAYNNSLKNIVTDSTINLIDFAYANKKQ